MQSTSNARRQERRRSDETPEDRREPARDRCDCRGRGRDRKRCDRLVERQLVLEHSHHDDAVIDHADCPVDDDPVDDTERLGQQLELSEHVTAPRGCGCRRPQPGGRVTRKASRARCGCGGSLARRASRLRTATRDVPGRCRCASRRASSPRSRQATAALAPVSRPLVRRPCPNPSSNLDVAADDDVTHNFPLSVRLDPRFPHDPWLLRMSCSGRDG